MKDQLGNRVEAGNLVLWGQFVGKVKEVHEGLTVIDKAKGQSEPTYIVLELKVAVEPRAAAPVIRVVDPASEALLESIARA